MRRIGLAIIVGACCCVFAMFSLGGCGSTCDGKFGIVVLDLAGVLPAQVGKVDIDFGDQSLSFTCEDGHGGGAAGRGIGFVCDSNLTNATITLSGSGIVDIADSLRLTVLTPDGSTLLDRALIRLAPARLKTPDGSESLCERDGALASGSVM